MNDSRIRNWAAIAEVIGTVAVVVSLIFVIATVRQNTRALGAAEMNNIWAAWREMSTLPVVNNSELAAIRNKVDGSLPLSPVEKIQWNTYQAGRIDVWAQLYDLYSDGIISAEKWHYWDEGYWRSWHSARYEEFWSLDNGAEYDPEFSQYLNSRRKTIAEQAK